jgi:hypothetical protein
MNSPNLPVMTKAKTWVAAIGTTLTVITTALATVSVALADDAIDLAEVAGIVTAVLTAGASIYAVWRVPNKAKSPVTRENTWN